MATLAKQCSDSEAIKTLLSIVFGVLGGSEGKLSVNTQKISLLCAAGKLASNAISTTSVLVPLTELATGYFVKVLETEVHEGTLLSALESLGAWIERYRDGNVPQILLDWIPKGLALKSSTSNVRQAYLHCIHTSISIAGCAEACLPLVPNLMKIIETCTKQAQQISLVSEGVHAVNCLLKISEVSPQQAEKFSDVFKMLNDSPIFVNDRFLASAPPSTVSALAGIAEKMISQSNTEQANTKQWFRVMIIALTCNEVKTRKLSQNVLRKLIHSQTDGSICRSLLEELQQHLLNVALVHVVSETAAEDMAAPPGELAASGPLGSGIPPSATAGGPVIQIKSAYVVAALAAIVGSLPKGKPSGE